MTIVLVRQQLEKVFQFLGQYRKLLRRFSYLYKEVDTPKERLHRRARNLLGLEPIQASSIPRTGFLRVMDYSRQHGTSDSITERPMTHHSQAALG